MRPSETKKGKRAIERGENPWILNNAGKKKMMAKKMGNVFGKGKFADEK